MSKKTARIVVLVLIVAVIAGMWVVKNDVFTDHTQTSQRDSSLLPENLREADFSLNISEAQDIEALAEYNLPLVIDYGADYCAPCKAMKPNLEAVNEAMYGKAFVKYVDVEEVPEAIGEVPVQVIPTQVFINKDGTPFVPSEELSQQIVFNKYVYKDSGEHAFTIHQGILSQEQLLMILAEMGAE